MLFIVSFSFCHALLLLELVGIGASDKPIMHPMTNKFQNVGFLSTLVQKHFLGSRLCAHLVDMDWMDFPRLQLEWNCVILTKKEGGLVLCNSQPSITHFPPIVSWKELECMTIVACSAQKNKRQAGLLWVLPPRSFTNGATDQPRTNNYLSTGPPSQDASC